MNIHPYVFEMLMRQEQWEVKNKARQAWYWTDLNRTQSFSNFISGMRRKKVIVTATTVRCCNCC